MIASFIPNFSSWRIWSNSAHFLDSWPEYSCHHDGVTTQTHVNILIKSETQKDYHTYHKETIQEWDTIPHEANNEHQQQWNNEALYWLMTKVSAWTSIITQGYPYIDAGMYLAWESMSGPEKTTVMDWTDKVINQLQHQQQLIKDLPPRECTPFDLVENACYWWYKCR